ncbi:sperm acrosome membrane-associated protein 4-like [Micropterus dolomieu]|uniref:sperm acrosome membrane-associated protein 4-like n=1 Tax=Micropterus dolomieu TaxID=147949 RepID=UPI001E8EF16A|nr:sperm acrosome membrane-associated protein 4-like [Micropterus dolomieu]
MKIVILALFVFLAVSQSEALKCYCGGLRRCPDRVETCPPSSDVCAGVIFTAGSTPSYFKGCMKARDCALLNQPGVSTASCCRGDLCNR